MNVKIKGGQVLGGEISPSGYKNSAVALIPASILFDKPVKFTNVPDITDVERLVNILQKMGSKIDWNKDKNEMAIDNSKLDFKKMDKTDLGNMKGVSLLWGPMLSRFRKVHFEDLPGGCTLGFRTLESHYKGFADLGVSVKEDGRSASMSADLAKSGLVFLPEISPTATENLIMLSVGLKGKTTIIGAASEPQVQDLCNFLIKCGAKITGAGSSVLEIEGGYDLDPVEHRIMADDYEIATFISIAASTGGELSISETNPLLFKPMENIFNKFNVHIEYDGNKAFVPGNQKIKINYEEKLGYLHIKAQPWPGLLVDTLPLYIPLALKAKGLTMLHNWMYNGGLFWTSELNKLGASIIMSDPHRIIVQGGRPLVGGVMEAPYIIRATIAMMMSAMIAEGETTILNADVLYRGHPHFSENLKKLGASIKEINT